MVSKEWMVERGFMEQDELTKGHPLYKVPVTEMKLKANILFDE
jgi:hypothetical protein